MKISVKLGALAMLTVLSAFPLVVGHGPIPGPQLFCQADVPGSELFHDYHSADGLSAGPFINSNLDPCSNPPTPPADPDPNAQPGLFWDGDYDWAEGGAILAIETGGRSTPPAQSCGSISIPCDPDSYDVGALDAGVSGSPEGGAQNCWGMQGHHDPANVYVQDVVFGDHITVSVFSNYRRAVYDGHTPEVFPCGDNVFEPCDGFPAGAFVDQVNCNGRDCKAQTGPALGTAPGPGNLPPAFVTLSDDCQSGQGGVLHVIVGSPACKSAEIQAGVCPPPSQAQTQGPLGHVWTN